jgi:hypothetical protein
MFLQNSIKSICGNNFIDIWYKYVESTVIYTRVLYVLRTASQEHKTDQGLLHSSLVEEQGLFHSCQVEAQQGLTKTPSFMSSRRSTRIPSIISRRI